MHLRAFLSSALSASILVTSTAPVGAAGISGKNGDYFFRYRAPISASADDGSTESKDVTVFYVAGVGFPFEELLPLKPEWQKDSWRVVSGSLPPGIVFDAATRTFSGTPTTPVGGTVVKLEGYDQAGNFVARANVSFDVVILQGTPVPTTLYAHTNHFKVDELPVPAGMPAGEAIESWARLQPLPAGVGLSNRYVEGTPTKPGTYRLLITGRNYKGDVVATYFGKYVVEDGPTFANIPDMIYPLPQLERGYALEMRFGAPNPFGVQYAIDPKKGLRYYIEKKTEATTFPGTMASNDYPQNLDVHGWIYRPYDQATIRFKAVDVDGTEGRSNWFTFGSSDPQPDCNRFAPNELPFVTGYKSSVQVPAPLGAQGTLRYNLVSGTLPDALVLDAKTGVISGQPKTAGENRDIAVSVDVVNGEHVVSSGLCLYRVTVSAGNVRVGDLTEAQNRHVRTGAYYDGVAGVSGGIPNYDLAISDPTKLPYLSLGSPTLNQPRVAISGQTVDAGTKAAELTLSNGDGSKHTGYVTFQVHDDLSVGPVPDLHVKRMAAETVWGRIPYDASTVVPDVASGETAKFAFSNGQALPHGTGFDKDGYLSGSTSEPAGSYGPFTTTISDFTGQTRQSNEFHVVVDERDPIQVAINGEQKFNVEWDARQTRDSFSVTQPPGARGLAQTWTLRMKDGSAVPGWLSIDPTSGRLSAAAGIDYSSVGVYGPFVATVTDADGSSASSEFPVTLQDWPAPGQIAAAKVSGSATGTKVGEAVTTVPFPDLKSLVDPGTVIGGVQKVTFAGAEPSAPAGMTFDAASGKFVGPATEAFKGSVAIGFKDERGRAGTLDLGVDVRPYPAATMRPSYDIPQLALAESLSAPIMPVTNDGYWSAPEWSIDTSRGTDVAALGLSVDPTTGMLQGELDAPVGTVVDNVVLKATSLGAHGEVLRNWTEPFSLTVTEPEPVVLAYEPSTAKYFLPQGSTARAAVSQEPALPKMTGSYRRPLTWTTDDDGMAALADAGLGLDPATGTLTGVPSKLGHWNILITASDRDGRTTVAPAELKIVSTLAGDVTFDDAPAGDTPFEPIKDWVATAGRQIKLRVGEPFHTPALPVKNFVPPVTFTTAPYPVEAGLAFDAATGRYLPGSSFATAGFRNVLIDAIDSDGRTMGSNKIGIGFVVVDPLAVSLPAEQRALSARQYSAVQGEFVDIAFSPSVANEIGKVTYSIEGDVPGTLVVSGTTTGALPKDAIVFDPVKLTLKGVASKTGSFKFRLVAHDSHADDYMEDTASRVPNNTARTQDVTLAVSAPNALVLRSSENPKGVVVPGGNGVMSVVPVNPAYGEAASFTVTGTLPPGVDYTKDGTGVYFKGSFTGTLQQLGTYGDISIRATDSVGRQASLKVAFNVFLSSEAIVLGLQDVTTKVGYPVSMQSTADNYYGALRFYSYDLASSFGGQLALSQTTGLVSGTLAATGEKTVNIYVTDATNRVTSKPLKVKVIPNLKVTVPAQVLTRQAEQLARTVLTDYRIGAVAYSKANPEAWPSGVDVDPTTGTIVSNYVKAEARTYSGLQIKAVDTFLSGGVEQTDAQVSNTFSIVIGEIDANPSIVDLGKTVLGKVGTAVTPLVPKVVDDVQGLDWTYAGTTFSANYDLSQYGLTFDSSTGRISGTPTAPFVIRDFKIAVRSSRGDRDETAPFWLGVAPKDDIAFSAGQQTRFVAPINAPYTTPALKWDNTVGTLFHDLLTLTNGAFDPATGSMSRGAIQSIGVGQPENGWPMTIRVTDEFGRSATVVIEWKDVLGLSLDFPQQQKKAIVAKSYSGLQPPLVTGGSGGVTYEATGVPPGMSVDASTGTLSGAISAGVAPGTVYTVAVRGKDSSGATASKSYTVTAVVEGTKHRYWRVTWLPGTDGWTDILEAQFMGADDENFSLRVGRGTAIVTGGTPVPGSSQWAYATSAVDGISSTWFSGYAAPGIDGTTKSFLKVDFGSDPVYVGRFKSIITDGTANSEYRKWSGKASKVQWSDNGTDWTDYMVSPKLDYNGGDDMSAAQ